MSWKSYYWYRLFILQSHDVNRVQLRADGGYRCRLGSQSRSWQSESPHPGDKKVHFFAQVFFSHVTDRKYNFADTVSLTCSSPRIFWSWKTSPRSPNAWPSCPSWPPRTRTTSWTTLFSSQENTTILSCDELLKLKNIYTQVAACFFGPIILLYAIKHEM